MHKVVLTDHELALARHSGSARWYKARARGEGGGPRNGSEYDNQIGCIAEVAMAKWKGVCCCLVLLSTQQQVEADVGFEPYCGTCAACTSNYRYQVKATKTINGCLYVKRSDPRDERQLYWCAIITPELLALNTVKFAGYMSGPEIEKDLERYCEIAREKIPWEPGEDQTRALFIPQNELHPCV